MPKKKRSLTSEQKLELYYLLKLTRAVEEIVVRLYKQGRVVGGVYLSRGMEAASVGAAYALEREDVLFPIHRDTGAHLAKGQSPRAIFLQYLGRANSPSRGRDPGIHFSDRGINVVGNISHLGSMIPVAVGTAMAMKLAGKKNVSLNFIGEGGSNIGDFHEGLNLAAVQKAPFVLVVENNQFAYSTPTHLEYACENIADRAVGYGIPGELIDGTDVVVVYETVKKAVERARRGEGPTLIEAKMMRLTGHSAHDDAKYVPEELKKQWEKKDPILVMQRRLRAEGLLDAKVEEEIDERIRREIEEAVEEALASPLPEPEEAAEGVYA